MLAELTEAARSLLVSGGLRLAAVEVSKGSPNIALPAAYVAIDQAAYERITDTSRKCVATLTVVVLVKDLASEKDRRYGLYPILEGIVALLGFSALGLAIKPLSPERIQNITDKDLSADGISAFAIDFSTSWTISATDPEESESAVDLLRIGLNYFLQDPEDDGVVDAEDLVEIQTEGD